MEGPAHGLRDPIASCRYGDRSIRICQSQYLSNRIRRGPVRELEWGIPSGVRALSFAGAVGSTLP
jgi:hypothetical protein